MSEEKAPNEANPTRNYSCKEPPTNPMNLTELAKEMEDGNTALAAFLGMLICRTNSNPNDADAKACIEAFFKPSTDELSSLCIPVNQHDHLQRCTDQNLLISAIIYRLAPKAFGGPEKH